MVGDKQTSKAVVCFHVRQLDIDYAKLSISTFLSEFSPFYEELSLVISYQSGNESSNKLARLCIESLSLCDARKF